MKIRYLGHSCFQIISDNGTCVLADPYTQVGYELPQGLSAQIVTISHAHFDHNYLQAVSGVQFVANEATVYEFNGIEIRGENSWHDEKRGALRGKNIIFKIKVDGIEFCHLGDLGESCREDLLQKIGKPDVLLLPVGGRYTIDALQAKEYADKIGAKLTIPMHYLPQDGCLDIAAIDAFLHLTDKYVPCLNGEYIFTKKSLDKHSKEIVYMERTNNAE